MLLLDPLYPINSLRRLFLHLLIVSLYHILTNVLIKPAMLQLIETIVLLFQPINSVHTAIVSVSTEKSNICRYLLVVMTPTFSNTRRAYAVHLDGSHDFPIEPDSTLVAYINT